MFARFTTVLRASSTSFSLQSTRQFSFVSMNSQIPNITSKLLNQRTNMTSFNLSSMQGAMESTSRVSPIISQLQSLQPQSIFSGFMQKRWATRGGFRGGSRGNTYQPNSLKRKRRLGFLARMRSRTGRRIVKDRKEKGRWFLTY